MPASKRKVDMRGVKDRSGFRIKHFPEGDYRAKIIDVDDHTSSNDNEGWVWTIQVKNAKFPYYTMLEKNQLWKVRNLFVACGVNVPKKLINIDPNKLVGKELGVTLEDDEYEGRLRSVIGDTIPLSELLGDDEDDFDEDEDVEVEEEDDEESEDEEEEEPAPKKKKKKAPAKKKKKKAPEPEDDEESEDEEEEIEEEELEELDIEEI